MPPLAKSVAILCRAAVQLAPTATGEMMYMPGGIQSISPIGGGIGQPIQVIVDASGAAALERQRAILAGASKRPYFDFGHKDENASFWPESFYWQDSPAPGIYCRGEWSTSGRSAVEGKEWRQFSPVFHVSDKRAKPARIICREDAKPNMGGLINDPAFKEILPLWAKNADGAPSIPTTPNQTDMTPEELAALQAKNKELQTEVYALKAKETALKAQGNTDALVSAEIKAKEMELKSIAAELEITGLKAKNADQDKAIQARNKEDAEAAVKKAVSRGAIATKDTETQTALTAQATRDPSFIKVIDSLAGAPALAGRITPSAAAIQAGQGHGIQVVRESARAAIIAMAALLASNNAIKGADAVSFRDKGQLALQAGSLYRTELMARMDDWQDIPFRDLVSDSIKAADYSDPNNQLGTLSGTLVLQRVLELFTYKYPELLSVFTDFSDAPGLYNQTETTRIIIKPAVQTYNPALGGDGRPLGWQTASPAVSSDVPVTLNQHVGIPIVFGQDILASTARQLFGEVAPAATSALGGYFVNMLTALMTSANFPVYGYNSFGGGNTTNGSTACTCTSTVGLSPGLLITGTNVPAGARVANVSSGTAFTLNVPATGTVNNSSTVFSTALSVPAPYLNSVPAAAYVKALADFNLASLDDIGAAFSNAEVPEDNRAIWLNSSYYARLLQDPNMNYFIAQVAPEMISKGRLPELRNLMPFKAPFFPTATNGVGFAFHKAALIAKSRLPVDFTKALNAMVPGSVTTVTDPATRLSMLLVQYVNLTQNYAEWRIEALLGAAPGEKRAGLLLGSS